MRNYEVEPGGEGVVSPAESESRHRHRHSRSSRSLFSGEMDDEDDYMGFSAIRALSALPSAKSADRDFDLSNDGGIAGASN